MDFFGRGKKKLATARELVKKGKTEEAEKYFLSWLEEEPANNTARVELALLYFEKDNLERTKQILLESLIYATTEEDIHKILEITNFKKLASEHYFNSQPCFSLDGKKIVFVSARRDTNNDGRIDNLDCGGIYLIELKTGEEKLLVPDTYYNSFPSFSPGGEKIIYLSARRDTNGDGRIDAFDNPGIYILDLETNKEKEIIPDTYRLKYPFFSPIGEMVLFLAWRPGATHSGIYLLDLTSGKEKTVAPDVYDYARSVFSPDGTKIVYTSWRNDTNNDGVINFRDNTGIYLFDLEGEREYYLVSDRYNNMFPVFSPDSKSIAFLSYRRDTNRDGVIDTLDNPGIYLYSLETRKEKLVVSDDFYNKYPTFNFDGKLLVYIGSWRGREEKARAFFERKGIYIIEVSGRNEHQIMSDRYYGCRELIASPVENKIVYTSWRKGTNRGLYLTNLISLPTSEELRQIITENFV